MYFPLFVGVLCLYLFCYIHYCVSILCLHHLIEEEKAGCLAIIVLQMYCNYKCYVALPHGSVVGLQCVIVVFPDHTHLLFLLIFLNMQIK